MSRIGNKYLSGFVATQEQQGIYIKQMLDFSTGETAILDPCCGEGAILSFLAEGNDEVITYGVEIEKRRAKAAKAVLNNVIEAPIESMIISNDAFGMILLNPPYDFSMKTTDEDAERKEYTELKRATKYLMPGGLLIYIIPAYRYADSKIARFLATHFNEMSVARFTDEDYSDYKQVVFFGKKKRGNIKQFSEEIYNVFLQFANEDFANNLKDLETLSNERTYSIPQCNGEISTFYTRLENKNVFIESIKTNKQFQAFIERTKPKTIDHSSLKPILPLAQGQLALLLASGAINGVLGSGDNLHVVQGLENVSKIVTEEESEHSVTTKVRMKREISVKIITPAGTVKKLS
ncbi:DUF6094 domain-containing protein [Lysinibacillus sp. OL1]|uniref:DUF6094 domain-containing protein n=1 Tax=Lysinibacillus sp. OL1 TaxID=2517243 RepID=UPI001D112B47|nr:DUF6094 domain-containing protein [Lysinibacillus sp. OL1]